jgi:hypothetical protein
MAGMGELEGLVIESPVYSDLAHQIEEMAARDVTGHMVVWEAGDWSHDQGKYRILDYDTHLVEPTLLVWGHDGDKEQGGKYEIIPKPDKPAWIRYYYPNSDRTREGELTKLAVFSPDFMYENTEDTASFLEKPFEIISRFK